MVEDSVVPAVAAAKKKKKKKKICRGRGSTVAMAGRWSCWLPVVEMVAKKLTVMTMVIGMAEKERV
jgi:hypothetical protein